MDIPRTRSLFHFLALISFGFFYLCPVHADTVVRICVKNGHFGKLPTEDEDSTSSTLGGTELSSFQTAEGVETCIVSFPNSESDLSQHSIPPIQITIAPNDDGAEAKVNIRIEQSELVEKRYEAIFEALQNHQKLVSELKAEIQSLRQEVSAKATAKPGFFKKVWSRVQHDLPIETQPLRSKSGLIRAVWSWVATSAGNMDAGISVVKSIVAGTFPGAVSGGLAFIRPVYSKYLRGEKAVNFLASRGVKLSERSKRNAKFVEGLIIMCFFETIFMAGSVGGKALMGIAPPTLLGFFAPIFVFGGAQFLWDGVLISQIDGMTNQAKARTPLDKDLLLRIERRIEHTNQRVAWIASMWGVSMAHHYYNKVAALEITPEIALSLLQYSTIPLVLNFLIRMQVKKIGLSPAEDFWFRSFQDGNLLALFSDILLKIENKLAQPFQWMGSKCVRFVSGEPKIPIPGSTVGQTLTSD